MERFTSPLQTQLLEQIQALLADAFEPNTRVNGAKLAEQLGVSRTPVREVLRRLAQQGLVGYERGRGFVFTSSIPAPPRNPAPNTAAPLDERVTRDIALGTLGSVTSERALMHRYAVARGVLVSTLRKLMRDGLVEPSRGRGWRFVDVGPATVRDSYRLRMLIEPAAILCDEYTSPSAAISELDAAHAAALDNLAGLSGRALFDLDARFHVLVASGAGSEQLVQVLERQNNIRRVHEYMGAVRLDRLRDSMLEHRRIMAALLRGERQMAAALMRLHLQISEDETFRHMDSDLEAVRAGRRPITEHRGSEQESGVNGID